MKLFHALSLLLSILWLAGCASPAARIKRNPELFASFPPEVQEKVRQGRIDIGFNSDMVNIALGSPDRTYTRSTAEGTTEVWSYVDYRTRYDQQLVSGTFHYRDSQGRLRTTSDSVWVDVESRTEYERIRIEFRDQKVVAIEQVEN